MQRKACGTERPRHINWIGERASTAQRRDAPPPTLLNVQVIMFIRYPALQMRARRTGVVAQ